MLCASSADHTVIRLVEPPAGTPAGARVTFPGFEGEPATAAQVAKKKILEGLLPDVRRRDILLLAHTHTDHFYAAASSELLLLVD